MPKWLAARAVIAGSRPARTWFSSPHLAAVGRRIGRMRRRLGEDDRREAGVPPLVRAAIENLREVAAKRLEDDADAEAKIVELLARAATELKKS